MDESKKALIAEVQEVTGRGRGEQKIEMGLQKMTKEERQLSSRPGMRFLGVNLGSPGIGGWAGYDCPSCSAALRYLFVPPPWGTPRPLKCPECGADLGISGSEVVKTVQVTPPSPSYPCPHCTEVFGSYARMFEHIERAHAEAPPPSPTYTCPHCGQTFGSYARLFEHIEREHAEAPPIPIPTPSAITKIGEWMKAHWPGLTIGSLGLVAVGTVIVKRRKRR